METGLGVSSILMVEDQPEIQQWLSRLVARVFPDARIMTAATLEQGRQLLTSDLTLLMVDLSLPDGRGDELIREIKRRNYATISVVVTSFDDDDFLFPALKAGADGYLLKDQPESQLEQSLAGIVSGTPPISPTIAFRLFEFFRQTEPHQPNIHLTQREKETLQLLTRGYSVKECATRLGISPHTVSGYVKDIYRKLEVTSRAEAAIKATQMGLC